jgi:hypothetical protein
MEMVYMSMSLLAGLLFSMGAVGQPLLAPAESHATLPAAKSGHPSVTTMFENDSLEARRLEIFQVLRGGDEVLAEDTKMHLWRLAGNLARASWIKPRMSIQVVVRNSNS